MTIFFSYHKGLVGEKPNQAVNNQTENREIASAMVKPMTCTEIQDNISRFPEVINTIIDISAELCNCKLAMLCCTTSSDWIIVLVW